ncbi:glycosyltransferase family 2 protein [Polynucleobacter sp. Ross1-W9]|uniref:glycosyltransferase family 2 protein n=1 Tax=Polynucleobacter parvulilacunae TaxID=1855631 RepID=UPI001C0B6288|nr:glycosyltransferase family 2 protein [Polynucleobacter parvulilacunae]MBU3556850.1 glycosyltransferase family 2 protein [Polynucleobacter parvulilacunae]
MTDVIAIIITYNPEHTQLERLLETALPQVDKILIVDNGSHPDSVDWIHSYITGRSIEFHLLGENRGIATAQNVGIALAKERGANHILIFDHDSLPAPNMVGLLLAALKLKESLGVKVGAVGPNFDDSRFKGRVYPFVESKGMRLIIQPVDGVENIIPVSWLIASGSLIPIKVLDEVGYMADELFIDYVDIEWGLRAHQKGYQLFGVCDARMEHNLGENPTIIFGRVFCFHSPIRHYYQFRNPIWLYLNSTYSLSWKIGDFFRLLSRFIFYAIFVKPHIEHIGMMIKGMYDGILGHMGKIDNF